MRQALRNAAYRRLDTGSEGEGALGRGEDARERSELEGRFLRLCHKHGLPLPLVNERLGPYTVDFVWPEQRLAVEVDGWQGHRGRQAFEDDRERDAYLRLEGYKALRFTWRQVTQNPESVVAVLRRYLS